MSVPEARRQHQAWGWIHPLLVPRYWFTIIEATAALGTASLLTRLLPFHSYIGLGARRIRGVASSNPRELTRIIDAIAARLPIRAVCLQRGLALQWMLRRRGVDAVLHYGIQLAPIGEQITAHVWVSVAAQVVLGGPQDQLYTEVMRYPPLQG